MKNFAGEELFWCRLRNEDGTWFLSDDDVVHITRVMRHQKGDSIYVTDGDGKIHKVVITEVSRDKISVEKLEEFVIHNRLKNFIIAIPRLKGNDKLEFLLEKLTEIGYSRFLFFESDYCVGKGFKLERYEKVIRAASKQSFTPFSPELIITKNFKDIFNREAEVVGFDLEAEVQFTSYIPDQETEQILVCGPEGGLSKRELGLFKNENLYRLTKNRLKSETAILYSSILVSSQI
jgi:16S rRNA (uracil1498-N3)-methyltransferase